MSAQGCVDRDGNRKVGEPHSWVYGVKLAVCIGCGDYRYLKPRPPVSRVVPQDGRGA